MLGVMRGLVVTFRSSTSPAKLPTGPLLTKPAISHGNGAGSGVVIHFVNVISTRPRPSLSSAPPAGPALAGEICSRTTNAIATDATKGGRWVFMRSPLVAAGLRVSLILG